MSSSRFFYQVILSSLISNFASSRIGLQAAKTNKKSLKLYVYFLVYLVILITFNISFFFMSTPSNLFEQIGVTRSLPLSGVKQYVSQFVNEIKKDKQVSNYQKNIMIEKWERIGSILSHPARRLAYDVFGQQEVQFAWAFKSQQFLNINILSSFISYAICTVMTMLHHSKDELKNAFKFQIIIMIISFIWQVDLIMNAESRLHLPQGDLIDYVHDSFPIFQRRQIVKDLLISTMSIPYVYIKYLTYTESQVKFKRIGKSPKIREICNSIRQRVAKINPQQHLQQRITVLLSEIAEKQPLKTQIFAGVREILKNLLYLQKQNIFLDKEIKNILQYYIITNE